MAVVLAVVGAATVGCMVQELWGVGMVYAAVGMGWARAWGRLECLWVFCPGCGRAVGECGLVCFSVWRGLGAVSVVEGV